MISDTFININRIKYLTMFFKIPLCTVHELTQHCYPTIWTCLDCLGVWAVLVVLPHSDLQTCLYPGETLEPHLNDCRPLKRRTMFLICWKKSSSSRALEIRITGAVKVVMQLMCTHLSEGDCCNSVSDAVCGTSAGARGC